MLTHHRRRCAMQLEQDAFPHSDSATRQIPGKSSNGVQSGIRCQKFWHTHPTVIAQGPGQAVRSIQGGEKVTIDCHASVCHFDLNLGQVIKYT